MEKNKQNKFIALENFITTLMYGIGILTCSLILFAIFKFYPTQMNTGIITCISSGAALIAWAFIKLNIDINKKNEKKKEQDGKRNN